MFRHLMAVVVVVLSAVLVGCPKQEEAPKPEVRVEPAAASAAQPDVALAVADQAHADMSTAASPTGTAPVLSTVAIYELRLQQASGASGVTEDYVEVTRIATPGTCDDIDMSAHPIPANAQHAVNSTQPHWKIDGFTLANGKQCHMAAYTESPGGLPSGHALRGFDIEPELTQPPDAP